MRQIALKKKVGALLGKTLLPPATPVFDVWSGVAWWRRGFTPADLGSQAVLCQVENLECKRLVTEYLSLRESCRTATIRVGEALAYRRDLDSHPREFRNRRITFIRNEEKLKCQRCRGKGRIDCSPDVPCPSCKGRRTRNDFCFTCGGSGRAGQDQKEQCWSCSGRGTRSEDCVACAGVYSGSTGRVRCNRCGGAGWVVCRACAGAGEKVCAQLATRHYTGSIEDRYQLGSMCPGQLKNGLAPRHFASISGDLAGREFQTPTSEGVALQRLGVYTYAIESRTYRYKGRDFYVSRISSGGGVKFVSKNLPLSIARLFSAGVIGTLAICLLASLLLAF